MDRGFFRCGGRRYGLVAVMVMMVVIHVLVFAGGEEEEWRDRKTKDEQCLHRDECDSPQNR